jgi:hypothetical protein
VKQVALGSKSHKTAAPKNHYSARHAYAVKTLPVLDRSVALFDQTVSAVSAVHDLSSIGGVCNTYGTNVNIMSGYFDNVPHPYRWYTPVGSLHHSVMGVYHLMEGALQACQTASDAGDNDTAATAISDMASADRQMHDTDNYVRWLSHQP